MTAIAAVAKMEKAVDGNSLSKLYRNRFGPEQLPRKYAIWQAINKTFIQKYIAPSDIVLDVAAGYGEFINTISASEKHAIDLNPDAQRFMGADVSFYCGNSMELLEDIPCSPNVVFASNFLEHLPSKEALDVLFARVHDKLPANGKFIILGPNLRYLPGKYWDFYDHTLGLTHLSLMEALLLHGFVVEKCIAKTLPYTMKSSWPTHPALVTLYLKIPLVWPILGKQFFVVARKAS